MWDVLNLPGWILIIVAAIICGAALINALKTWSNARTEYKQNIINEANQTNQIQEQYENLNAKLDLVLSEMDSMKQRMVAAEEKLHDLTVSDMHDIKSWIVEQYHKFYNEQGWIDSFSAETLDRRHQDYQKEGGNSYIDTLMERLHSLPMDPPVRRD